jgi:hypothetical protein
MFTEVAVLTALVSTEKVAVVAPAVTVTLSGTVAAALSLARITSAPPASAGLVSVTVPVEEVPPVTLAGLNDTDPKLVNPDETKTMSRK